MDEIYEYCDKIVANGIISKETLAKLLKDLAKTKPKRIRNEKYNPYKSRANTMNNRARKMGVEGTVTAEELEQLMNRQPCCQRCGRKTYLVFDHIVSMYNGGENTIDNLQVLCRMCNMEKGVGTDHKK